MNKETDNQKSKNQCNIDSVSISSLIEKANAETKENRRRMFSNLNKATKDIEPYDNTDFLNMVSAVSGALN